MKNKSHTIWAEKYRPTTLDTYIGNERLKSNIERYIKSNDLQHLIFYGKTGTGKTTAAKIIINNIDCDYIYLNGSDENGIDTVRDKIKLFVSVASFKPLKIVVLDDCQNFTPQAQQALLNLIETYSLSTRFIFTCNALEKLIPALQSRCEKIHVTPPSKKEVAVTLFQIFDAERIDYEIEDVANIINKYYPDIRRCINAAQGLSSSGTLASDTDSFSVDYLEDILNILNKNESSNKKWNDIRQIVADNNLNDFTEVYKFLFDNINKLESPDKIIEICIYINEAQVESVTVPDREISFMTCISKIISSLHKI